MYDNLAESMGSKTGQLVARIGQVYKKSPYYWRKNPIYASSPTLTLAHVNLPGVTSGPLTRSALRAMAIAKATATTGPQTCSQTHSKTSSQTLCSQTPCSQTSSQNRENSLNVFEENRNDGWDGKQKNGRKSINESVFFNSNGFGGRQQHSSGRIQSNRDSHIEGEKQKELSNFHEIVF